MKNKNTVVRQHTYVTTFGFAIVGVLVLALFAAIVQDEGITGATQLSIEKALTREASSYAPLTKEESYSPSGDKYSAVYRDSITKQGKYNPYGSNIEKKGPSSSSPGVTQAQFNALKKEVASLKNKVASLNTLLACRKPLNGPNGELLGYYIAANCGGTQGAQTGGVSGGSDYPPYTTSAPYETNTGPRSDGWVMSRAISPGGS